MHLKRYYKGLHTSVNICAAAQQCHRTPAATTRHAKNTRLPGACQLEQNGQLQTISIVIDWKQPTPNTSYRLTTPTVETSTCKRSAENTSGLHLVHHPSSKRCAKVQRLQETRVPQRMTPPCIPFAKTCMPKHTTTHLSCTHQSQCGSMPTKQEPSYYACLRSPAGQRSKLVHTLAQQPGRRKGKSLPGRADCLSLVYCNTHRAQQCCLNTWREPAQGRIRVRLGLLNETAEHR